MATESLYPDGLTLQTNLTGAVTDIDDDPDSPDGLWLTADSNNANSDAQVTFPTPTGNPTVGAGLQQFRVWARITANATAVSYNLYLANTSGRLNGGVAIGSGTLTSTTGQLITASWNASLLTTADGSDVRLDIEMIKSGGAPSARTTGELGAVEWVVDYSAGATTYPISAATTSTASITQNEILTGARNVSTTSTGTASSSKLSTFYRSISTGINSSPSLTKLSTFYKTVTTSLLGTPTLTKGLLFSLGVSVVNTVSVVMDELGVIGVNITSTITSSPITSKITTFVRSITTTITSSPSISRLIGRTISTSVGATVNTIRNIYKSIATTINVGVSVVGSLTSLHNISTTITGTALNIFQKIVGGPPSQQLRKAVRGLMNLGKVGRR